MLLLDKNKSESACFLAQNCQQQVKCDFEGFHSLVTFTVNVIFSTLSGLQSENTSLKVENVDLTGNISLRKDVLLYLKISKK